MARTTLWIGALFAVLAVSACGSGELSEAPPHHGMPDYYVDAVYGDDSNSGLLHDAFKTISHALTVVQSGESIRVLPGTYDAANGEIFPLVVPAGVLLLGDEPSRGAGRQVIGGGVVPSWASFQPTPTTTAAAIVLDTGSIVAGLHIENPANLSATDIDACIVLAREAAVLRSCTIRLAADFGVWILNADHSEVRNNHLDANRVGIESHVLGLGGDVLITANRAVNNEFGVRCAGAPPDLGGGALGGAGGNTLAWNTSADLVVYSGPVHAKNNAWNHVPPTDDTSTAPAPGIDVNRPAYGAPPATVHVEGATLAVP